MAAAQAKIINKLHLAWQLCFKERQKQKDKPNEGWEEDKVLRAGSCKDCKDDACKERKKENRQPKGGMGRHAATTQGF